MGIARLGGGGLNPCPDGLGHFFREEFSKFKWAFASFWGGLNHCQDGLGHFNAVKIEVQIGIFLHTLQEEIILDQISSGGSLTSCVTLAISDSIGVINEEDV